MLYLLTAHETLSKYDDEVMAQYKQSGISPEAAEIVSLLEAGGLTLEESIKCYQQGAELEKKLENILDKTRRDLAQLTHLDGECEIPLEDEK